MIVQYVFSVEVSSGDEAQSMCPYCALREGHGREPGHWRDSSTVEEYIHRCDVCEDELTWMRGPIWGVDRPGGSRSPHTKSQEAVMIGGDQRSFYGLDWKPVEFCTVGDDDMVPAAWSWSPLGMDYSGDGGGLYRAAGPIELTVRKEGDAWAGYVFLENTLGLDSPVFVVYATNNSEASLAASNTERWWEANVMDGPALVNALKQHCVSVVKLANTVRACRNMVRSDPFLDAVTAIIDKDGVVEERCI